MKKLHSYVIKMTLFVVMVGCTILAFQTFNRLGVRAQENTGRLSSLMSQTTNSDETYQVFLPVVTNDYTKLATRMGFGVGNRPIDVYKNIRDLRGGLYLNWNVGINPRPGGIEFAQLVFIHQKLSCGLIYHSDRNACPYAQPYEYVQSPNNDVIAAIARIRPGQVWLIGNETDRVDWWYCKAPEPDGSCQPANIGYNGQGEMIPETYAKAYHNLYTVIKTADPTAKVAIGGVIQATPLRLQYLSLIWDTYQSLYGTTMPVDIWNVHNFILREQVGAYGAEVPPGLPGNPTSGLYTDNDCTHFDLAVFDGQIRAFRQWMKDRNQQEKPLIITEYGFLYSHQVNQPKCTLSFSNPALVYKFMIDTFDYFRTTKDCTLGYTADSCRLVQRWVWFNLDHSYKLPDGTYAHTHANGYSSLFDVNSLEMTEAGKLFSEYAMKHLDELNSVLQ